MPHISARSCLPPLCHHVVFPVILSDNFQDPTQTKTTKWIQMEQWTIRISPYFTNLNSSNSEDSYFSHLCSPFPPIGIDNLVWELHDPDDIPSASFFSQPGTNSPWHFTPMTSPTLKPFALHWDWWDRSSRVEGHLVELYQASLIRKPSETRIRQLVGVEIFDKNVVGWHNASPTGWEAIYTCIYICIALYSIVIWICDGPACQMSLFRCWDAWVFGGNQLDLRAPDFGGVAISLTYIEFFRICRNLFNRQIHNLFLTLPGFECHQHFWILLKSFFREGKGEPFSLAFKTTTRIQWGECYHYFRVTCHHAAAHNMINVDK